MDGTVSVYFFSIILSFLFGNMTLICEHVSVSVPDWILMGGSRKSSGMCVQRPLSDDTLGPSISAMKSKRRNPWHTNTYSILPTDPRIPVLAPSKADPARGALLTYPKDPA